MTTIAREDRAERIRSLVHTPLEILRRTQRSNLTLPNGTRVRDYEFRHNALALSFRRWVDFEDRPSMLTVEYDGDKVLTASWTVDGWTRRSYSPGRWENVLRRCERMPAPP
ncbi:hypothetical protein [Bradyrhizobium sp. CB3481]|uniref:hypothetical protein n=1 Tax=Bradyrhizobium sp. CB3481 TaxID=3039158 RepID=UPI0024B0EE37|nr:hypothetical protein [Bradyrhizobium sp. CB3481]WFU14421.1 hypothetical protein QA643_24910 [Bradyrhizobium sp. CB3481]